MRLLAIVVVLTATCLQTAAADDGKAQALIHFKRGNVLYDLQRYVEAAKEYEEAFESKDDPVFLFNIGQAYRRAGKNIEAIGSYKAYLRRSPNATNRQEVEARIEEMQKQAQDQLRTKEKPPVGPITTSPEESIRPGSLWKMTALPVNKEVSLEKDRPAKHMVTGWLLGGGGILTCLVGGLLAIGTVDYEKQATRATSLSQQQDMLDAANRYKIASTVIIANGVGSVVTGVIWLAIAAKKGPVKAIVPGLNFTGGSAVLTLGGVL